MATKTPKVKPETEVLLEKLQEEYLTTRDPLVWKQMFEVMVPYAKSLTLKVNKGKVFLDPDHILGVATDAAIKIMEKYNNPDFKISFSFAGLLHWKVIESLYGSYKEDTVISLNSIIQDDSSSKVELEDLQGKVHMTPLTEELSVEEKAINDDTLVTDTLNNIITEFDTAVDDFRLSLLARTYILLWLRKSKVRNAPQLYRKILDISPREEELLDLLLLEVRNRITLLA